MHRYAGDMDNHYLNLAVYMLEDFLKTIRAQRLNMAVRNKGTARSRMSNAELVKTMAAQIEKNAKLACRLAGGGIAPAGETLLHLAGKWCILLA
jgi:hypothetical protein